MKTIVLAAIIVSMTAARFAHCDEQAAEQRDQPHCQRRKLGSVDLGETTKLVNGQIRVE